MPGVCGYEVFGAAVVTIGEIVAAAMEVYALVKTPESRIVHIDFAALQRAYLESLKLENHWHEAVGDPRLCRYCCTRHAYVASPTASDAVQSSSAAAKPDPGQVGQAGEKWAPPLLLQAKRDLLERLRERLAKETGGYSVTDVDKALIDGFDAATHEVKRYFEWDDDDEPDYGNEHI